MQQTRKTELWVGSFVLAGICAILVMIFQVADVKGLGSGNTYTLKAQFDNIGSLKVRSPVKVGGVVIGRVSDISLNPETLVPVVSLSINSLYNQFPDTSSVQILTSGLIGEQYIGLVPGFVFEDEQMLKDGDFIEDTKSALVLEDLIGQVLYSVGNKDETKKE
ncbi:outer membrane lipid asymmetry maintenance protein MlaD [Vibrio vulnificus]|uniref:Outer membrane lipid asymmetry maintenance protein MlaD n=1 Tax=Vibrio vulnificus TaxID=672 RepID=A0A8H9MYP8_VIBVL|nr:outer membrane lipid asymmetry maintenance protein MlaD [Vibrio vulnificus]EGQ9933540.1 outer membrane lipid asymmetry maintenance protein MlaD [Vibrio vulnificus]EID0060825.1 outer membrane lipid asymmetry maintenance protein MlaD [Vibrio vulnificus]EID0716356.1 outer membrane lipid asymmetry maintenance protein MlaD [Vibrio vulnificus]EID0740581.1 outer membrane lipid asymmetry maintenance protein MlaD [Vibrio vulnificus]EIV8467696.1 outer membrane lipid asymmetry maintenance protein MlaD